MDEQDALAAGAVPRDPPRQPATTPSPGKAADDAAFSAFYRGFVSRLAAFLMMQGARLPDAAEIAQDTMIKTYERWSEIENPAAWARRVASRAWVRRIASIDEDPVDQVPERSSLLPLLTDVEALEQRHEVLRVLGQLPPRQRQIMAWTLEGYTPTEIANELKINSAAVRANLMKARRALAAYLGTLRDEQ